MKSIENLKKEGLYKELSNEKLNKIFGGELIPVNVGNIIVDDLNGLIR
jgi:bacteriocin-like protein